MANHNTTLRLLLSQQKPHIRCTSTATRNSTYTNWPKLNTSVVIWDEFNLINLNESYGHVLDFAVPDRQLVCPQADQELAGVVIENTDDINHLISWNDGLMKRTLQFAKSHLGLYPGISLRHEHSTADRSVLASLRDSPGKKTSPRSRNRA